MVSYLAQRDRPDYGMEDFKIYAQRQAYKEQERYEIVFLEEDTVASDTEFKYEHRKGFGGRNPFHHSDAL